MELVWKNDGAAPIYFEWPVMMYIYDAEGNRRYWEGVDVDLTVLSSTMVYSEVYNMLYNDPAHYLGKTVKARGTFSIYQLVTDGVLQPDPVSYACIISDATACCAEGMEFVLKDDLAYPDDYPELGTEITVIGEFQSYEENGMTWYHLVNARLA